jgi:hypothetical protein
MPASRFVFEARFRTVMSLGDAVSKRLFGTEPSASSSPNTPAQASGLLNRYPEAVGIPERYAAPKAQSTASSGEVGRARCVGRSTTTI